MSLHNNPDSTMSPLPSAQSSAQCIDPTQIQEGDLLAFVDGAAAASVGAHIADCPACQSDVADLAGISALFGGALFRMSCPPTEDLLSYQVNLLGRGAAREIDLHLQSCEFCQAELAELAAVPLPVAVTPGLGDRLYAAGRRLIQAVLTTPGAQPSLQLRGDEQTSLVYQAGDFQVILAKVPPVVAENIWQIEGQLIADTDAAQAQIETPGTLHVTLLGEGDPALAPLVAEDAVDDLGFFALEGLASGTYALEIGTADAILYIKGFTIP